MDELPEGCTTVGAHIGSSHLNPSKMGDVVRAEAEVTYLYAEYELLIAVFKRI